jgi:hypothetical protein
MKDRDRISACIIITVMVFLIINIFIVPVEASPFTTVTITFEESPSVDVSPGSSEICKVNGEVKVVKVGPDQVKVYLEANSTFQSTSISPATLVFAGPSGTTQTQSFSVSIKVPQGTSCSETGTVTVFGHWIQGGFQYNIAPVSTIVCVEQYYKIEISTSKTQFLVDQGDNININLGITNKGNGDDSFRINFDNQSKLEDRGFVLPGPIDLDIDQGAHRDRNLNIGIPKSISGSYLLKVCITSKGSESSNTSCTEVIPVNLEIIGDGQGIDGNGDGYEISDSEAEAILVFPLIGAGVVIIVVILIIIAISKMRRGEIYAP